jgi:hypothetical protein
MTDYCDHFGFNAVPFSKEIDDDKLWLPPSKKSIVRDLVECVQERKHAVVTGESGAGKTCVTRAVRHGLGNQAVRLTYCHNVTLGRRDFYRHLCHALGVPYGSNAGDVFLSVTRHVEDLARERGFPVFLVDSCEAPRYVECTPRTASLPRKAATRLHITSCASKSEGLEPGQNGRVGAPCGDGGLSNLRRRDVRDGRGNAGSRRPGGIDHPTGRERAARSRGAIRFAPTVAADGHCADNEGVGPARVPFGSASGARCTEDELRLGRAARGHDACIQLKLPEGLDLEG